MRAAAGVLLFALAGCAAPAADGAADLLSHPDVESLHSGWGTRPREDEIWAALGAAGVTEIYGYEDFPEYEAAFVFTEGGRHFAMFFADRCGGPGPIQRAEVDAATMDRLRRRVAAEWPPAEARSNDSPMCDGVTAAVYVLRDGRTSHAVYYDPDTEFSRSREHNARFLRHFAVTSLRRAVRAAMPLEFFSREEPLEGESP